MDDVIIIGGSFAGLAGAAKPACPASTPPATSPIPSRRHRSLWHHRRARWRVSSPSSRCWLERKRNLKGASPLSIIPADAAPFLKSDYGDELIRSPRIIGAIAEESVCQEK
jgi:hypothetical protein